MADYVFEKLYRDIFADLSVDHEESEEIKKRFEKANPPPDKLVWLRAAAFRIGCEFLSDDKESNISLLRSVNAIVHILESTCMVPKKKDDSSFDEGKVTDFYRDLFSDLAIDKEESEELASFFQQNSPPASKLIWTRASAFRVGSEFLTDDKSTNISLFRSINVIVHLFETNCMTPKPYQLKMEPPKEINVQAVGVNESISKAAQYLWDLDVNRLTPNQDYVINVQRGKKPWQKADNAPEPLFTMVKTKEFRRQTYRTFIALLDNYISQTGVSENVTRAEKQENMAFLKAIMQTAPMQFCHKYCRANNPTLVPASANEFIKLLYKIWFDLYFRERGGRPDSSGFEHVFVGEIKNDQVSGFHNWIQFYLEEKRGNIDYRGYIKPKNRNDAETDSNDHVLTLQFKWNGVEKSVGTSFIGVSPEFEMALYTMCFLVGEKENEVMLDTGTDLFKLNIKCFSMSRDKIGTSFAEALAHEEA
uniref:EndoU domain-containing protein n=1 Tax=Eucampia antarctica TaxID=49252 RepID=A0A7S2S4N9_9STRA|mmetsp:Transcript_31061/g.29893  ORF Transcript_31061/g.29893 Transcript_31061/m.29893 type:complete len:476 (+) Transcript_31061:86-1513(+)|eukprot:CAMPEP_0197832028 /NCGR_PEP_ID=MMETSP1437-20131217/12946_1 /TAXON_ID=49252 ORGANISM="Eucampia antarctica, Strain CCMP1452" /NCGR_SAMPLE_ID=MMETSP1437 /ASSEMBLY_ACC=CAM_ASM_001096 /LENGTH=475 /DNA_ID=CAMNT_0043435193 /DNA_START=82 /DNA_END=1509 /DNA_ORIENTATION=+